jgi:hypothetical protein
MGFYLRLDKPEIGWSELRAFEIELFRFVPSEGKAYVASIEQLLNERSDTAWLAETPRGESTFALFRVSFRDGAKNLLAGVSYSDAQGASIRYKGGLSLRIELIHQFQHGAQQCTVFCPTSGESRTGPNPCIDCRKGNSVVRICC